MSNQKAIDHLKSAKALLDTVSPSMCFAKWTQSTLNLHNGYTHSCHHPIPHRVDEDSILRNPKTLHNTVIKIQARKEMIEGKRPSECDYCWNIENLGKDHISDRTYKSATEWSLNRFDEIVDPKVTLSPDFMPSYLEVSFDHTCNFKCVYCFPETSSRWMEEVERHGPYNLPNWKYHDLEWLKRQKKIPIKKDEYNPYTEAFWKAWPDWYQVLHTFRITGGEPLLSKHTWKVLNYIEKNPNPKLHLAINTNLCVPDKLIDRLVERMQTIRANVKTFTLFTSLEATGQEAEYIRYGMNYVQFLQNCHKMLSVPELDRLNIMTTIGALSYSTFDKFLLEVLELRKEFSESEAKSRVGFMVNYLRHPPFMDSRVLPDECKRFMVAGMYRVMRKNGGWLYLEEIDQLNRYINYMNGVPDEVEGLRSNLNNFLVEVDRRRGTDHKELFPLLYALLKGAQK